MIHQMLSNWVCWAIVAVALVCYQQLWEQWFSLRDPDALALGWKEAGPEESTRRAFTSTLIGAMPLLGLLGTIIGLLSCFADMARNGAGEALLSGGIADALLTTQFGLVCAVPGWVLQGIIHDRSHNHSHRFAVAPSATAPVR